MIASLIVLLHLTGIIAQSNAVTSLYIAGIIMIIAEIGIISFGMIAFNGLIALYAGYTIQSGNDMILGIDIGWPVLFGIALVETLIIVTVIAVHIRLRNIKASTGPQSMIGNKASIIEWDNTSNQGSLRYDGEIWKAVSEEKLNLNPGDQVAIKKVSKLKLTITK